MAQTVDGIMSALPIRKIVLSGEGATSTGILPLATGLYAGFVAGRWTAKNDIKKNPDAELRTFWIGSKKTTPELGRL